MVNRNKTIVWGILFLVLAFSVSAVPGVPHHFYGSVTINGEPAPDGSIIEAFISGDSYGVGSTNGGSYGYSPVFYVQDPAANNAGKTITFKVEDITAATSTFENGESTRLNLDITCDDCIDDGSSGSGDTGSSGSTGGRGGGGGGGGGAAFPPSTEEAEIELVIEETSSSGASVEENLGAGSDTCTQEWECSKWTACANGVKERICIDRNACGETTEKPAETEDCGFTDEELFEGEQESSLSKFTGAVVGGGTASWISLIIIVGIIAGLLFVLFRMKK